MPILVHGGRAEVPDEERLYNGYLEIKKLEKFFRLPSRFHKYFTMIHMLCCIARATLIALNSFVPLSIRLFTNTCNFIKFK